MFENKVFEGIYYSRFIASYMNVRGKIYRDEFRGWLKSLIINGEHMPDDVVDDIVELSVNGKLELEENCRLYFKE